MFQQQHYVAIAKILCEAQYNTAEDGESANLREIERLEIIEMMAKYFSLDNPHFKRSVFLKACRHYNTVNGIRTDVLVAG